MMPIALARVFWSTGRRAIAISGLSLVLLVSVLADRTRDEPPPPAQSSDSTLAPGADAAPVASLDAPPPTPGATPAPNATAVPATSPTPSEDDPPSRALADLPLVGPGTFDYAPPSDSPVGTAPYLRYSVAVEHEIGVDPDDVAAFVESTLADPRSWTADGGAGFERVAEGGTFTLVVASPATVDRLCLPLDTAGQLSCGANGYIALNLLRWETAVEDWPADLTTYRTYLVNHEVGHYIIGAAHPGCPAPGELAPVMMQQSKGLDGCRPNGWPYPDRGD